MALAGAGVVPGSRPDIPVCGAGAYRIRSTWVKAPTVGRSLLRISGTLLVGHAGRILHTGGEANAPRDFLWCMPAVDGAARLGNRFGAVLAGDGVALKQVVATVITVARSSDLVATVPREAHGGSACRHEHVRAAVQAAFDYGVDALARRGCMRIRCTPGCAIVCERPLRITAPVLTDSEITRVSGILSSSRRA